MNKQTGGKRKEKRQQSQKQKNALKKAMQSPLQKLWKDIMKQVKIDHPKLSLKEQMKKASPIYQKAKANAAKGK